MDLQPIARGARDAARLSPGTRLGGGRYTVGQRVRACMFAELYEATDATTGNPVTIHVLDPRLVTGADVARRLSRDAANASTMSHKNIAQVIELAVEGEHTYLATEFCEGHSLRELLDRKRETGTLGFGAKGALNILSHAVAAVAAAGHPHGVLTVDSVSVSRAGRIRVCDFGLAGAAPFLARIGKSSPGIAPEVLAGASASPASDVFSLGAILYEVLVGAPPVKGCTRPSEAVPGIPAAVDGIIARAMSPQADKRYPGAEAFLEAAMGAMTEAAASSSQPGRPSGSVAASGSGQWGSGSQVSLAEAIAGGGPSGASAPVLPGDEKWLISKGKLDYGPFSLAQIGQQIQANQILPGHVIIDKDTGGRKPVEEHPLLGDIVEAAKQKRDELRRANAEVQHATQEKRRGTALYVFIGLGVLALGGGVYLLVEKLSADKARSSGAVEGMEAGSLEAKISFPSKAERQKRARKSAASRKTGGSTGTAGGWDDSLNLDMSGDDDGGSERLSDGQVNPVIQRQGGSLGRCLTSTTTHNANIEFIVKPTGIVSHVRVNGQTGTPVANCVRTAMTRMKFPSFDGARSKHYFDIAY